jgi:hypothetical protein
MHGIFHICNLTSNDLLRPRMTSDLKNSNRSILRSVSGFQKHIVCKKSRKLIFKAILAWCRAGAQKLERGPPSHTIPTLSHTIPHYPTLSHTISHYSSPSHTIPHHSSGSEISSLKVVFIHYLYPEFQLLMCPGTGL